MNNKKAVNESDKLSEESDKSSETEKLIVPKLKKISKDKLIKILRDEVGKRDRTISRLREENELLFKMSLKNARKKIQEASEK